MPMTVKVSWMKGAVRKTPEEIEVATDGATIEDLQGLLAEQKWEWTADAAPRPGNYVVRMQVGTEITTPPLNTVLQDGETYLVFVSTAKSDKRGKAAQAAQAAQGSKDGKDTEGAIVQAAKKPRATKGTPNQWMMEGMEIETPAELEDAVKAASRASSNASYARKVGNLEAADAQSHVYATIQAKIAKWKAAHGKSTARSYEGAVAEAKAQIMRDQNRITNKMMRTLDASATVVSALAADSDEVPHGDVTNMISRIPAIMAPSNAAPSSVGSNASMAPTTPMPISADTWREFLEWQQFKATLAGGSVGVGGSGSGAAGKKE